MVRPLELDDEVLQDVSARLETPAEHQVENRIRSVLAQDRVQRGKVDLLAETGAKLLKHGCESLIIAGERPLLPENPRLVGKDAVSCLRSSTRHLIWRSNKIVRSR